MEKEAQAEYAELLRRLYEATPTQARRVHARYMLGMKVKDIAAIHPIPGGKSIHAALRRLRRYAGNGQAAYENHQPEKILLPATFVEVPDEVADAIVEESRAETPMTPSSTITVTLWTHPPAWKTISRSRPFPRRIF